MLCTTTSVVVLKGVQGGALWTGKPQARNPTHTHKSEGRAAPYQHKHYKAPRPGPPSNAPRASEESQALETQGSSWESSAGVGVIHPVALFLDIGALEWDALCAPTTATMGVQEL